MPVTIVEELDGHELLDSSIADWVYLSTRPRHNVFLSHSGAQKNFVEQLCLDLERAHQSPFFDKRLPIGEEFAPRLLSAARDCEVAVVVVSEAYFSRAKWPMLELAAIVQSPSCPRILPLFFGLSCKKFKEPRRRERWYHTWEVWARSDDRICVSSWKEALRALGSRTGMHYVHAMGEVTYRQAIVATVCDMMVEDEIVGDVERAISDEYDESGH